VKTRVLLGIDIGGTNTKLAAISARGKVVAHDMILTLAKEGPESLFTRIQQVVPSLLGPRREIAAAGLGCAGLVDAGSGRLCSSPNLPEWANTPISRICKRVLGVYTYVDNDANAAAYGEYRCGCGVGARMFICITLGTGVGGGIVSDGKILRGSHNYAGEIGHMTISEKGPRCKCGNRGCLEAFVSADALVRDATRILRRAGRSLLGMPAAKKSRVLTPEDIATAARRGDKAAQEVFDNAAQHVGIAAASLVNVLNPDRIGLAGGVASGFDLMEKRIGQVVAERAFFESAKVVTIRQAQLGFNAATIGAALMAKDALRKTPHQTPSR